MLAKVLQEDSTLRELNRRVDQHIALQRAALGLPPPVQVTAIEAFLEEPGTVAAENVEAETYWHDAVQKVRDAWMAGQIEATGVAELFRGGKKVKWVEGVFEKESKSSDSLLVMKVMSHDIYLFHFVSVVSFIDFSKHGRI